MSRHRARESDEADEGRPSLRSWLIYRADGFLGLPPIVQMLTVIGFTALVVLAWAVALRLLAPAAGHDDSVWWSLSRFFDGGTMAGDAGRARVVALGVTTSGVLVMSFLTAAFASKMAERIHDLRSGRGPAEVHGHVLVLGYDAKVPLIAREIARSRQRATVVVLAADDKDRIELGLKPVRRLRGLTRLVVRTGNPRSEHALRRVAAHRARAIVVVPPDHLGEDASVHWSLATLLAVRRVVPARFAGQIIVESRHAEARDLLGLAGEPDVAGPGAMRTEIVGSDDIIAKVLAQAAREDGVYHTLRRLFAFDECELYLEPVPDALAGKPFDDAHAAISGAVLLGVRTAAGALRLNPTAEDAVQPLARNDTLVLLSPGPGRFTLGGTLAIADATPFVPGGRAAPPPERVVLLGWSRINPSLVRELDGVLPAGSQVLCVAGPDRTDDDLRRALGPSPRVTVTLDTRRPLELARSADPALLAADSVLILGGEDVDNGDADALTTLLWLRCGLQKANRRLRRIVTEVRDPRSAAYVAELDQDFLVSTEIVAMLLAQEALAPALAPIFRELMSPTGNEIFIRPRDAYVRGPASFADVMATARARGEIALGFYPPRHVRRVNPVILNPPRDVEIPVDPTTRIVVLARL